MSYLAIARKYRPATFDEIVGQEHVTRTLKNALERERVHHAFLFSGARGVGKTTAARALARALNCVEGPTSDPCAVCTSCTEILSGTSPDLIEIDGASNNSVEDVRELREAVRYAPTAGRWKIYLVDEVHMLSKAAFNALLKTLEEPPPHVVFIFATTEPNKIPDTILSRVQRFDFKRIPVPAVVERLRDIATAEGVTVSDAGLRMIARAGEGSMRDAQSLLDKVISFGSTDVTDQEVAETLGLIDRGLLFDMLEGLVRGDPARCLAAIDQVYGYGFELSQFTGELLEVLRNATFVALSDTAVQYVDVSGDELDRLRTLVDGVPTDLLTRLFTAMLEVHDQVSQASRPRIVLDMAVARLATTRPVHPVGELLGRLEHLERNLRRGGAQAPTGGARAPGGSGTARGRTMGRGPAGPKDGHRPPSASTTTNPEPHRTEAPRPAPPLGLGAPVQAPNRVPEAPMVVPEPAEEPTQVVSPPTTEPEEAPPEPPAAPAPLTDEERWRGLCAALEDLKAPPAKALAQGSALVEGDVLAITLPAGAPAARAQRGLALPAVLDAISRYFPGLTPEIREFTRSGSPADASRTDALGDPALRRIVTALDAEIDTVRPDRDDPQGGT